MTHQTLQLAVQHLVETQVITPDRFKAVYLWIQKRLAKKAVNSVTYELSDSQHITITRDTTTYHYSVEIVTINSCHVVVQPTEPEPTLLNAVPVQLSLFDTLEVDAGKAAEYFKTHKKVRRLKLVVDNTPTPQLQINFDALCTHADNVVSLCEVRQKQQLEVQRFDWGDQYSMRY